MLRARGELMGTRTGPGDPTGATVARRELLLADCEDMEQAAIEAAAGYGTGMADYLLRYVTRADKPPIEFAPCGRRQFYDLRRRYFAALHLRRIRRRMPRDARN